MTADTAAAADTARALPRDGDVEPFLKALLRCRPVSGYLLLISFCLTGAFGLLSTQRTSVLSVSGSQTPIRFPLTGAAWAGQGGASLSTWERAVAILAWPYRFVMCCLLHVTVGDFALTVVTLVQVCTVLEHWLTSAGLARLVGLALLIRFVWTVTLLLVVFRSPGAYYMRPGMAWLCFPAIVLYESIFRWRSRTLSHTLPFYVKHPSAVEDAAAANGTSGETADACTASAEHPGDSTLPPPGHASLPAAAAEATGAPPAAPGASENVAPAEAAPAVDQEAAIAAAAAEMAKQNSYGFHDVTVGSWDVGEATWGFSQLRLFGKIPLGAETLHCLLLLWLACVMDAWMEIVPAVVTSIVAVIVV